LQDLQLDDNLSAQQSGAWWWSSGAGVGSPRRSLDSQAPKTTDTSLFDVDSRSNGRASIDWVGQGLLD